MIEPIWIEDELLLATDDRQLIEHGGAEGLRHKAAVQSGRYPVRLPQ
jgi:hypothetical protein